MNGAKAILVGTVLALGLSAPALAHKDHQGKQAEAKAAAAAAKAAGEHAGMNHGTMTPRAAGDAVEIGDHDERRALVENKPFFVRLLDWLGRFHTAVVHFPVGLTLGAVIAEIIGMRRRNPQWRSAARGMLVIAAVSAVVAAILGWINAGFYMTDTDGVLTAHRWLGTALAVLAVLLALAAVRSARQPEQPGTAYWALLTVTGLAVAVQGYLGGSLVHGGLDHLAF